jgi:hypothetical protein
MLMLLFVSIATGQDRTNNQKPDIALVFELEIYEFSTDLARDIERIAQDRARLERSITEGKVVPFLNINFRVKAGETATIKSNQRVPKLTSPGAQSAIQVPYENIGVNISIGPTLTTDNRIAASLGLDFSSQAKSGGLPEPIFYQRSWGGKALMKSGEKVVLLNAVQQGSLWPSTSKLQAGDTTFGNFIVLFTGRILE